MITFEEKIMFLLAREQCVTFAQTHQIDVSHHGKDNCTNWLSTPALAEKNIYYWFACSKQFCDLYDKLYSQKKIELILSFVSEEGIAFNYLYDGIVPKAPIIKKLTKYKQPHWCPVEIKFLDKCITQMPEDY